MRKLILGLAIFIFAGTSNSLISQNRLNKEVAGLAYKIKGKKHIEGAKEFSAFVGMDGRSKVSYLKTLGAYTVEQGILKSREVDLLVKIQTGLNNKDLNAALNAAKDLSSMNNHSATVDQVMSDLDNQMRSIGEFKSMDDFLGEFGFIDPDDVTGIPGLDECSLLDISNLDETMAFGQMFQSTNFGVIEANNALTVMLWGGIGAATYRAGTTLKNAAQGKGTTKKELDAAGKAGKKHGERAGEAINDAGKSLRDKIGGDDFMDIPCDMDDNKDCFPISTYLKNIY